MANDRKWYRCSGCATELESSMRYGGKCPACGDPIEKIYDPSPESEALVMAAEAASRPSGVTRSLSAALTRLDAPGPALARHPAITAMDDEAARWLLDLLNGLEQKSRRSW